MPNAGGWAPPLMKPRSSIRPRRNSLNMRLDALQSRAATAERLLSEARQNLIARTEEVRAFDRKSVEATIARNNSDKRLAQIEGVARGAGAPDQGSRQARAALTERNNALTKTLKMRETALARAEEKIAALTERNGHLEADVQVAAPISKSGSRISIRRSSASAWNARSSKARWKPRARTIPACKAKWRALRSTLRRGRAARRCSGAAR